MYNNPTPGSDPELAKLNATAFRDIAGPLLERLFDGEEDSFATGTAMFTVLDVIVGYTLCQSMNAMDEWLTPFPKLQAYTAKLARERQQTMSQVFPNMAHSKT